jgi:hypothetical protein
MSRLKIASRLLFVLAALLILSGAIWYGYWRHLVHSSVHTSGRVSASDERGGYFYPTFEFRDGFGVTHSIHSGVGSSPPSWEVGDAVGVMYPPGSPGHAVIDDPFMKWVIPAIFGYLGCLQFIIAVILWKWPRIAHWIGGTRTTTGG